MGQNEDACARELLDVVPSVMRFIRAEMRRHRAPTLSIPQFRALVFIERSGGTSLGAVAEHLGLTPPSACKLVDGLQGRGLVTRAHPPDDRRRLAIEITAEGKHSLAEARRETRKSLAGVLSPLDAGSLAAINASMGMLRSVFAEQAATERRTVVHASA